MAKKQLRVGGYAVFATYKKYLFYVLLIPNLIIMLLAIGLFYLLKLSTLGFYEFRIDVKPNF